MKIWVSYEKLRNKWIDECNPVITKYSAGEHKDGTKTKFGNYYAEHCKK